MGRTEEACPGSLSSSFMRKRNGTWGLEISNNLVSRDAGKTPHGARQSAPDVLEGHGSRSAGLSTTMTGAVTTAPLHLVRHVLTHRHPWLPESCFHSGRCCVVLTPPAVSLQRWGMQERLPVPSQVKAGVQRGRRRGPDMCKGDTEWVDVPLP